MPSLQAIVNFLVFLIFLTSIYTWIHTDKIYQEVKKIREEMNKNKM